MKSTVDASKNVIDVLFRLQVVACRSSSSALHVDLRQMMTCRSSSKTRGDCEQRRAGPAHLVGRSPAILPEAQSTVLRPGATVASAGPRVPQILYARAVAKHCCAGKVWMSSKGASHLAPSPNGGQHKSRTWHRFQGRPTAGARYNELGTDRFPGSDPGQLILPGRSPGGMRGCYPLAGKAPGGGYFPGRHSAATTRGGRSSAGAGTTATHGGSS